MNKTIIFPFSGHDQLIQTTICPKMSKVNCIVDKWLHSKIACPVWQHQNSNERLGWVVGHTCQLRQCEVQFVVAEHTLCGQIEQADHTFILRTPHPIVETCQGLSQPRLQFGLQHIACIGVGIGAWFGWNSLAWFFRRDHARTIGPTKQSCQKRETKWNQVTARGSSFGSHSIAPSGANFGHQVVDELPCNSMHFLHRVLAWLENDLLQRGFVIET